MFVSSMRCQQGFQHVSTSTALPEARVRGEAVAAAAPEALATMVQKVMAMLMATRLSRTDAGELTPPPPPSRLGPLVLMLLKRVD